MFDIKKITELEDNISRLEAAYLNLSKLMGEMLIELIGDSNANTFEDALREYFTEELTQEISERYR